MRHLAAAILMIGACAPAWACPVCDTGTGREVRAAILDDHFVETLLTILIPFPLLLAVVAVIHFGRPSFRRNGRADPHEGGPRHGDDDND